jgi:ABC-type transport system involved in multi-copper enzyme maturation permease subunit
VPTFIFIILEEPSTFSGVLVAFSCAFSTASIANEYPRRTLLLVAGFQAARIRR